MIENFDKLDFNRKVDVLVAMHVFEWDDITIFVNGLDYSICTGVKHGKLPYEIIPCYSILLTSAWDIMRKFDYLYLFNGGKKWKNGKWECKLVWDDEEYVCGNIKTGRRSKYGWAETEMLAICYAGLKAVGFDVKGFLKEEGKV